MAAPPHLLRVVTSSWRMNAGWSCLPAKFPPCGRSVSAKTGSASPDGAFTEAGLRVGGAIFRTRRYILLAGGIV